MPARSDFQYTILRVVPASSGASASTSAWSCSRASCASWARGSSSTRAPGGARARHSTRPRSSRTSTRSRRSSTAIPPGARWRRLAAVGALRLGCGDLLDGDPALGGPHRPHRRSGRYAAPLVRRARHGRPRPGHDDARPDARSWSRAPPAGSGRRSRGRSPQRGDRVAVHYGASADTRPAGRRLAPRRRPRGRRRRPRRPRRRPGRWSTRQPTGSAGSTCWSTTPGSGRPTRSPTPPTRSGSGRGSARSTST